MEQEGKRQVDDSDLDETAGKLAKAVLQAGKGAGKKAGGMAAGIAGGPLGTLFMAAWSCRHTLFKVLACVCLAVVFLVVLVVSLPSIIVNRVFGLDGTKPKKADTPYAVYMEMSGAVADAVEKGHDQALARVETIISEGGYDRGRSMEALIDYAKYTSGYDVSHILAAYSVSIGQSAAKKDDMLSKLGAVSGKMFPVTSVEKSEETEAPASYTVYEPVTLTVVTGKEQTGTIDGIPQYRYETGEQTYYRPGGTRTSGTTIEIDAYKQEEVTIPVYGDDGSIIGTEKETYYKANGKETVSPSKETIKYVECTIHPFDNAVVTEAFGIDPDAAYGESGLTYAEMIDNLASALEKTLYGNIVDIQALALTDTELIAFVNRQECSAARKHILVTALSLVGKVPYFWGGKSGPGWNEEWGTPKQVTAAGSDTTGSVRPYGLDCSGFTDWTYKTALGTGLPGGTQSQWNGSYEISADELLPGDLGFRMGNDGGYNHVLIFAGYGEHQERMWVHADNGGIAMNSPSYESTLQLRRIKNIDFDAPVTTDSGTPNALEVEVTHYCPCEKCNGKNAGINAMGKPLAPGMVAMSSYYPFGTQIMINGNMYTVEDRGGAGIENNIHRVDIFVPAHEEALRLGRYRTIAVIYGKGE